jgi:UDP-N-acetylmuramate dehydrogenase
VTERTLADHTTLRVGGPADDWILAETEDQLVEAVRACDRDGTPVLLVGGGSNLLVADEGFRGTVVEIATRGVEAQDHGDRVVLRLAAGETWDDIVSRAVARGWGGIEALSGIPGRVGATPVQNVGAYGAEIADVLVGVRVLDRATGQVADLGPQDCAFGYRTSAFKQQPGRWVVLEVTAQLRTSGQGVVRYAELARALGVAPQGRAPVAAIRGAVLSLRSRKGMVLAPDDPDTWSAGSFFTNPVLDEAAAAALPEACPRYPAPAGVKVSAAWLIEQAGIDKGYALPGSRAALSGKHTLALTNRGGATAAEIIALARAVRSAVQDRFAIDLVPEPVLVGLTL